MWNYCCAIAFYLFAIIYFISVNLVEGGYLSWRRQNPSTFKVVTNWSQYRPNATKYTPINVDPFLCTHVIYAFATLNTTSYEIKAYEWNDETKDNMIGRYDELNNLKKQNPSLKTLLAIGGWTMGSQPFSDMAISETRRKTFVNSTVKYLRKWNFDGLDIDWEFPAKREGSRPEDKQSLNHLVRELREAFYDEALKTLKEQLMLTIAVAAEKYTTINAYDIENIVHYLDFVSIMSYDYHGSWDNKVGHNSPLRSRKNEKEDDKRLSVDWSVRLYATLGVPLEKLIVGIPLYGRTFTLKNENDTYFDAETVGSGTPGEYTREAGFLSLFEICKLVKENNWTREWSIEHQVPFAYRRTQWIGYDDDESIKLKTQYVAHHCLGGAMIWTLDLDDFNSLCYKEKYPMTKLIVKTLSSLERKNCAPLHPINDSDVINLLETSKKSKNASLYESAFELFLDNLYDELMNISFDFKNSSNTTYNASYVNSSKPFNSGLHRLPLNLNELLSTYENSNNISNSTLNYVDESVLDLIQNASKKRESGVIEITKAKIQLTTHARVNTTTKLSTLESTSSKKIEFKNKTLDCTDRLDGELIADPADCAQFFTCHKGKIIAKRKCTNNLYFDPLIKVCNWPHEVNCE